MELRVLCVGSIETLIIISFWGGKSLALHALQEAKPFSRAATPGYSDWGGNILAHNEDTLWGDDPRSQADYLTL